MDIEAADREAAALTSQGMALVAAADPAAIAKAVGCFDRAIRLRQAIIADGHPEFAYGLASGWLNRGEALLLQRADRDCLLGAIASFDEGLRALSGLAWQDDANVRYRMVVGWQNRGLALHALERWAEAKEAFEQALAVLDATARAEPGWPPRGDDRVRGAIWANLANTLVTASDPHLADEARTAAMTAMTLARLEEAEHDSLVAETAIKARYVLCRVLASALPGRAGADESATDTLHVVTDAVDEGLALARHWEQRIGGRFGDLTVDLVRFGSRVYARYQPQFLDEFVAEHLTPSRSSPIDGAGPGVRLARLEALWLSFSRESKNRSS